MRRAFVFMALWLFLFSFEHHLVRFCGGVGIGTEGMSGDAPSHSAEIVRSTRGRSSV